jgi:copper oxidase (laccase) domain-containing protein
MIANDQPTCFGPSVIAAISSVADGDMRFSGGDMQETTKNRHAFLAKVGISPEQTTRVQVTYDNAEHFARYSVLDDTHKSLGMSGNASDLIADALVVKNPGHALFLLIADCVGVIVYDTKQRILMVSHIGRHSAEVGGGTKSIDFLTQQCGSHISDLNVWLSPAAGKTTYPLHSMNNCGLHEIIIEQLMQAGIAKQNIEISSVDTTNSADYFSHSQFLSGQTNQIDGRFAIVAMMR